MSGHGRLTDVRRMGVYQFLHTHLIEHHCNTDLIGCRSEERLDRLKATQRAGGLAGLRRRLGF